MMGSIPRVWLFHLVLHDFSCDGYKSGAVFVKILHHFYTHFLKNVMTMCCRYRYLMYYLQAYRHHYYRFDGDARTGQG
ncbi:hypothetical protein FYJ32_07050 [Bifidobacterium tsurumiense]|nr:hypothetical protein [Bifidobacterium tsurumiense]